MNVKHDIREEHNSAIRSMGVAVIFFAIGIIVYGLNYANILNITSSTEPPSKELLNYNYLAYGAVGILSLTVSFLFALASLSQSKESPIIIQFSIILIGWMFGVAYSFAVVYIFQHGWPPVGS